MTLSLPAPAFAAAVMLVVAGLSYEPHILTAEWPAGHVSHDPATSPATCRAAADAWMVGRGLPIGETLPAVAAEYHFENDFAAGSECIAGRGCDKRGLR